MTTELEQLTEAAGRETPAVLLAENEEEIEKWIEEHLHVPFDLPVDLEGLERFYQTLQRQVPVPPNWSLAERPRTLQVQRNVEVVEFFMVANAEQFTRNLGPLEARNYGRKLTRPIYVEKRTRAIDDESATGNALDKSRTPSASISIESVSGDRGTWERQTDPEINTPEIVYHSRAGDLNKTTSEGGNEIKNELSTVSPTWIDPAGSGSPKFDTALEKSCPEQIRVSVGFDTEWPSKMPRYNRLFMSDKHSPPALLQIALLDHILLAPIIRYKSPDSQVPYAGAAYWRSRCLQCRNSVSGWELMEARLADGRHRFLDWRRVPLLRDLLSNKRIRKIGDAIDNDVCGLKNFSIEMNKMFDCRKEYCDSAGHLCQTFFGRGLDKQSPQIQQLRLADWLAVNSTMADYAATDALAPLLVYFESARRRDPECWPNLKVFNQREDEVPCSEKASAKTSGVRTKQEGDEGALLKGKEAVSKLRELNEARMLELLMRYKRRRPQLSRCPVIREQITGDRDAGEYSPLENIGPCSVVFYSETLAIQADMDMETATGETAISDYRPSFQPRRAPPSRRLDDWARKPWNNRPEMWATMPYESPTKHNPGRRNRMAKKCRDSSSNSSDYEPVIHPRTQH